jgi:2,3-bisphosphoglycerate-independent phosphoglycerate mutase
LDTNPFAAASTPFLERLLGAPLSDELEASNGEVTFRRLDANLGHQGLPQSATGQGTLLTGSNCADAMGRHYGPWPGPTIRSIIERGSLFSEVRESGGKAFLANAYPPGYFTAIESGRARVNVPVHAARSAGLELSDLAAYGRGEAAAADLTGEYFASVDPQLPILTPEEAGRLLARLAARNQFTFFDFWLSDRIGHRGSFGEAIALVGAVDRFLEGVADGLVEVTLIVTSDHGNLEDKGVRGHTRAEVPLIALGPGRAEFDDCSSLLDVAPAVRRLLRLPE